MRCFHVKEFSVLPAGKRIPGPIEAIIVGLGNPGSQYEGTRHNTGFMVLDRLAEKTGARIDRIKFKGLCGITPLAGKKCCCSSPPPI